MEVSCFSTSKPLSKTMDLVPSLKIQSISHKKKLCVAPSSASIIITCCLKSGGDDNREPILESDWRSFRAKLVAKEQSSGLSSIASSVQPENMGQVQLPGAEKWAHKLHEPEKGCLLIATEKLDGVHIFERTVVLILSTGPLGPTGIILNRPSLMSIKETKSTGFDVFWDKPLFFGGPLEEGVFLVGPRKPGPEDGVGRSGVFDEVMSGLYYGTKESLGCASEMVKRNVLGVDEFRFFDGYCGWEKEQLNDEIRAGYWNVVACSPSVVGLGSYGLWEEVLGLVGEKKVW